MSYRSLLLASGLALAAVVALPAAAAHPHYERLLQEGAFALERGNAAEAVAHLRLACFGYLEEPAGLAGCLVRLAQAQAADEDAEGFRDTFRRIAEVEDRFHAYSEAEIPPETRQAFELEVTARIPPGVLGETPGFDRLAPPEEVPPGMEVVERTDVEAPVPPEERPAVDLLDAAEEARLARARELLAAAEDRSDLEAPWLLAREVADANRGNREAQHLAAVIAYRAARWEDAVAYFRRGGEPDEQTPEISFYFAVSLYEMGEREEAATVLRRSLPRIQQTPFVLSYREKILGPLAGAPENG